MTALPKLIAEKDAEIERLTADRKHWIDLVNSCKERIAELEAENKRLEEYYCEADSIDNIKANNERLRAALGKYGKHLPDCTEVPLFCDCGLLKAKQPQRE